MEKAQPHLLVASFPLQGHINPTLRLAKLLASQIAGARITFSTAVNAHRRMFRSQENHPAIHGDDALFTYIPYSNGYDDGFDPNKHDVNDLILQSKIEGTITLTGIVDELAARGRPVTCIIYSFMMSWAADIARQRGIPSFLYWIQSATTFAIYWHYLHGHDCALAASPLSLVSLPRLPPMTTRDLPSFMTAISEEDPYAAFLPHIKDMFVVLDNEIGKPQVIGNTAQELEAPAIESVADKVDIVAIGPLFEEAVVKQRSLFEAADEKKYIEWLDQQAERSVVYVSFGSISVLKKEQVEEIARGLRECGRPYLWVLRETSRWEGVDVDDEEKGIVVEWCSQVTVLGHRAVGCFVTHCGWNSTVESLTCGVPTVAVPQWTDQSTNAWLMGSWWGTGVRAEVRNHGLLEAEELRRCLEIVMGEGERAEEIQRKAGLWKEKAIQATVDGGSSRKNLNNFVKNITGI